jgi:hypothetical protein
MLIRFGWTLVAGVAALILAPIANVVLSVGSAVASRAHNADAAIEVFDPQIQLQVLCEAPERVTALAPYMATSRSSEQVFVGTGKSAGIFRFNPNYQPEILTAVALGLGDTVQFGMSEVNSFLVCDLNQDSTPDLVAVTSQIEPRGRPRLYAWSLSKPPVLLGVARPEIESSWSHGLGIASRSHRDSPSVFSTFCGFGEIIEYQMSRETTPSGFQLDGISWRQVGQLPASGEQAVTADADNDGTTDLCVASGYAAGMAAIRIYNVESIGSESQPRHVIDESERFGNVRFLVGDLAADGTNEVVAWWCSDSAGGDCEVVRYRLGADGLRDRTEITRGDASELWPLDGQMVVADIDDDGAPEVWFVTSAGNLWRYEPNQSPSATQVCVIGGLGGPLVASIPEDGRQCLYVGRDRSVLRVNSSSSPVAGSKP